jgi:hypothetical protein
MQDLQNLEVFEIELLELLNSIRVLEHLFFGGGTMLRLCHGLNRYSSDMDFWLDSKSEPSKIFKRLYDIFENKYGIIDSANKRNTLVFELKSTNYNRNLKIEIRKGMIDAEWERKIAFSKFSNKQVPVKGLTLDQMMTNKVKAFLSRKIIRDCFDIEFLLMRGISLPNDKKILQNILQIMDSFKEIDYKTVLGSILDAKDRKLYTENKFKFLRQEINKILSYD